MSKPQPYILITLLAIWMASACASAPFSQPQSPKSPMPNSENASDSLTYLALGDSYTIGEGVGENETYPAQLTDILAGKGLKFAPPKIIATTGWTTDELQKGIDQAAIEGDNFDLVTLLIGVNNQYRGRSVLDYQEGFTALLEQAISFAGDNPNRVIVISIPDWGVTRFAAQQQVDKAQIAKEIDAFNSAKRDIAVQKGVTYLDITREYRQFGHLEENMAVDGLHPSGLVYRSWAQQLAEILAERY